MSVKQLLSVFLSPHHYDTTQHLIKEKVITLNIVMIIMGIVLLLFSIFRFLEHNYIQFSVDSLLFSFIVLSYFLLYKNMNLILYILRFLIFFAIVTSMILIIYSPEVDTRFVWISICTYMMFFLLDLKEGVIWFLAMSLVFIGLYIADILHVSLSEFTIFFVSTAMLALLLTRYEKMKVKSEQRYTIHSKELQNAVQEKTEQLQAQKEMFETLFKKSFDGILLIEDKQFVECNDAIVKMLGYRTRESGKKSSPPLHK